MNIIDWMLTEKIAGHWKQAQNIIAGLHLNELHSLNDYDGIKARARLYRDWRNAGEPSKVAYQKAIAGEPVPAPMFEDVLHASDEHCNCPAQHAYMTYIAHDENCPERRKVEPVPAPEVTG